MATLQEAELVDVIVNAGESGKNLDRPGMQRLLALVERREVDAVIIAKLDRLTRSVKEVRLLKGLTTPPEGRGRDRTKQTDTPEREREHCRHCSGLARAREPRYKTEEQPVALPPKPAVG
jgi:hypothetical protein